MMLVNLSLSCHMMIHKTVKKTFWFLLAYVTFYKALCRSFLLLLSFQREQASHCAFAFSPLCFFVVLDFVSCLNTFLDFSTFWTDSLDLNLAWLTHLLFSKSSYRTCSACSICIHVQTLSWGFWHSARYIYKITTVLCLRFCLLQAVCVVTDIPLLVLINLLFELYTRSVEYTVVLARMLPLSILVQNYCPWKFLYLWSTVISSAWICLKEKMLFSIIFLPIIYP